MSRTRKSLRRIYPNTSHQFERPPRQVVATPWAMRLLRPRSRARPCMLVRAPALPHLLHLLQVIARPVVHSISAPVSAILAGSASLQKSFLCKFSTDFLHISRSAPSCIADGSAFFVESYAKGIRTCILNHGRCSATSDEIVNTFPIPWGDQTQSGVHAHLLCRSKLNTCTQCERDDVITANVPSI